MPSPAMSDRTDAPFTAALPCRAGRRRQASTIVEENDASETFAGSSRFGGDVYQLLFSALFPGTSQAYSAVSAGGISAVTG